MTLLKTDRAWLNSFKWAVIASSPICVLILIDSVLTSGGGFLPAIFYMLGMELYLLQSIVEGYDNGNFVAIAAWSCFADFAVIWLITYVAMRLWRRRKRQSAGGV